MSVLSVVVYCLLFLDHVTYNNDLILYERNFLSLILSPSVMLRLFGFS